MKKIVVLTGAGISAESGIKTFRDSDGLWNGYNVEDVASPQGFAKNPEMVLDFYNQRRKDILNVQPNSAHFALATLEEKYDVQIITQNIDDLHERGGSKKIMHLHGEIFKMRSTKDENHIYEIQKDILLGDLAKDGGQLRPHIVWFGEAVPMMEAAVPLCYDADILIIIGTSLVVYPAASLVQYVPASSHVYIIDKKIPDLQTHKNMTKIEKAATEGMKDLLEILIIFLINYEN
jgi:NAD-dependent deacetylase